MPVNPYQSPESQARAETTKKTLPTAIMTVVMVILFMWACVGPFYWTYADSNEFRVPYFEWLRVMKPEIYAAPVFGIGIVSGLFGWKWSGAIVWAATGLLVFLKGINVSPYDSDLFVIPLGAVVGFMLLKRFAYAGGEINDDE